MIPAARTLLRDVGTHAENMEDARRLATCKPASGEESHERS